MKVKNAALAGGFPSDPILSGPRRTPVLITIYYVVSGLADMKTSSSLQEPEQGRHQRSLQEPEPGHHQRSLPPRRLSMEQQRLTPRRLSTEAFSGGSLCPPTVCRRSRKGVKIRKDKKEMSCHTEKVKYAETFFLFNPHQSDQGQKGPWCFQRLYALKCLKCQKIQKIPNPSLESYLFNEPNFCLIK